MTKKAKATIIWPDPPPKLNSTPDPHAFASCMPMPNIKAPMKSETDTGASDPDGPRPAALTGINISAQTADNRKCRLSELASPVSRNWRQPDEKPY